MKVTKDNILGLRLSYDNMGDYLVSEVSKNDFTITWGTNKASYYLDSLDSLFNPKRFQVIATTKPQYSIW